MIWGKPKDQNDHDQKSGERDKARQAAKTRHKLAKAERRLADKNGGARKSTRRIL